MVAFTLDGRPVEAAGAAHRPALEIMREDLGCTGPKQGCGIGRCGACLVLLDGAPAHACLVPGWRLAGRSVTTRAGLDAAAIEAVLVEHGAFQCGACADGIVVALWWLLQQPRSEAELTAALAGHLCRCSGYGGLRRALHQLANP